MSVLAGADLEFCNLSGSDLHEANLRGANLKVRYENCVIVSGFFTCNPSNPLYSKNISVWFTLTLYSYLFEGCNTGVDVDTSTHVTNSQIVLGCTLYG